MDIRKTFLGWPVVRQLTGPTRSVAVRPCSPRTPRR